MLSLGISLESICIDEIPISDHKPVRFNLNMPRVVQDISFLSKMSRVITDHTHDAFTAAFMAAELPFVNGFSEVPITAPDEMVHSFNNVCSKILDTVAPFKVNKRPWLNEVTGF